jgi:hypothetical protein
MHSGQHTDANNALPVTFSSDNSAPSYERFVWKSPQVSADGRRQEYDHATSLE